MNNMLLHLLGRQMEYIIYINLYCLAQNFDGGKSDILTNGWWIVNIFLTKILQFGNAYFTDIIY